MSVEATRKFGIKSFRLGDIWYNYYKKGQYQEPHVHDGGPGLTAVHYLIFDPRYHSYTNFSDTNVTLNKGMKIAQLVLYPHVTANVSFIEEASEADRGDAGFGSTDK